MALVRIQVRRDTSANWDSANPVLSAGEPGAELDTGRFKVGDGVRAWRNLPYSSGAIPADTSPLDVGNRDSGSSQQFARADHSHAFPSSVTLTHVTAGSATVAGDLSVTGKLIGGTHKHASSAITDWATATSNSVFSNLAAGSNVTLTRNATTGVTTITATGGGGSGGSVTTVAGRTGDVLLSAVDLGDWPNPYGSSGKYLKTDGTAFSWDDPFAGGGVSDVNAITGSVTLAAGANVTLNTNPSTNTVTITANTTAGTGDVTSVNSLIGAVSIAGAAGSGLTVSETGSTIEIDANIDYANLSNVPATFAPAAHSHTASDVSDFDEAVDDRVDGLLVAGTNVTLTYDDAAGSLTIDAAGANAPLLVEGDGISIDTSVPGEAQISLDGTMDGGGYEGHVLAADPAYFSIQPQSQLVTFGTAFFTARVENADSPSYQWQKAESGTDTWLSLSNTSPYSGVTTSTLTVSPVGGSDNGDQFRLQVTLPSGSVLLSDEAMLTTVAIVITDQPASGEFEEADTIDVEPFLFVIADGGSQPLSYQWQKHDGSLWANVTGETKYYVSQISGTLGTTESQRVERWRVKITDAAGVVAYSDEAFITISAGLPAITLDPASQTIAAGAATFYAEYTGKGAVPSWERRTPGGDAFDAIGKSGAVTTPTPGVYRSTLALTGLTGNDNGNEYRLRVENNAGDVVSASATLGTSAPIISAHPLDLTVVENNQASFTVVASYGGGAITYQWQEQTAGGSWTNLAGKTSATLTLPGVEVPIGRDQSMFRVLVTGGGVTTTSKSAIMSVITAPAAGDAAFSIHPSDAIVDEGGGYPLSAVSSWLASTTHYAVARVEYDNGDVEYHPLSTGTSWNGTVARRHIALAHSQYSASLTLGRSAWVSVCISQSDPTAITVAGNTTTLQPFALAKFDVRDCSATVDSARPRVGIISHPVTQLLPSACAGSVTLNVPDPPYSYVESQQARVTVRPRQAFIGPVPSTGFWNPPTARQFSGACDTTGTHVVAAVVETETYASGNYGSYLYSGDGGKTWMTRNLPFAFDSSKVLYAYGKFYLFGRLAGVSQTDTTGTALVSTDNGRTFEPTGWNFGGVYRQQMAPSFAGNRLYCVARGKVLSATQAGDWTQVASSPILSGEQLSYVCYAHGRWYFRDTWSYSGTAFAAMSNAPKAYDPAVAKSVPAKTFHPVTLADQTQNYVLADNGFFAPVDSGLNGTSSFSPISLGQAGGGPQAGDFIYFGVETPGKGAAFYRKGAGNPGVNEKLLGHSTYWSGDQKGDWGEIQIMSYVFGSGYGPNLDMTYYNTVSDPTVAGAIFLPDRLVHLFRYRADKGTGRNNASIPTPPRR